MIKHSILVLILSVPFLLSGQTPTKQVTPLLKHGSAKAVGMSSERLTRLDWMAESAIENGQVPAIEMLVARKGKIIYHKAFGMANVATGHALETNDIVRIFSQTKAITSTLVMMLWEEGHFRLDDPISKWIPEFKDPQVLENYSISNGTYTTRPAKGQVTIRHLLTHSSGIGYGGIDPDERMRLIYKEAGIIEAVTDKPVTIEENIKKLAALPLHFDPGEKYYYSMGLDVLGYFVEILTEKSFAEVLQERIFDPLGMKDTGFYLPESKGDRVATLHTPWKGKWVEYFGDRTIDPNYLTTGAKTLYSGGGGLVSTATDYAKFLQMYLNGGVYDGKRFLSESTIETIMSFQVAMNETSYHGLAFSVLNEKGVAAGGLGSVGTFRWGGAANTQYFADPEEQVLGIIHKQTFGQGSDSTRWQFRQLIFQAIDD